MTPYTSKLLQHYKNYMNSFKHIQCHSIRKIFIASHKEVFLVWTPLLLPPPQTLRKFYLIFIYFPCNLVFKPPFPSKFPVNLFRCQVWFFFLKFIRQVLIVPFGHWMLAKIQGRVRASVVEQKINGGELYSPWIWLGRTSTLDPTWLRRYSITDVLFLYRSWSSCKYKQA